jgi:hypothetical protein
MTTLDLRDALQEGRLGESAKQKLASDINVAIMNTAAAKVLWLFQLLALLVIMMMCPCATAS